MRQNEQIFKRSFGDERFASLDFKKIASIRQASSLDNDLNAWIASSNKAIVAADITPRNEETYDKYISFLAQYNIGQNISQYINDIESDPHLYLSACQLRDSIKEIGVDPNLYTTKLTATDLLIVLDTGNGEALNFIIEQAKPKIILVYVDSWEYFVSSFENTDWKTISDNYGPDNLVLARYDNVQEIIAKVGKYGISFLDHAYVYFSSEASKKTKETAEYLASKNTTNMVNYTGFTNDEYNMLYNASQMLTKRPKMFCKPDYTIAENILVCGSGPSLDQSIDDIRKLSNTHLVIAAASSYGTLMNNNIVPDILCILERGQFLYEDYLKFVTDESSEKTILVTSSVCDYKLTKLFKHRIVFFRSSLTPLCIYSTAPSQCLPLDGPQAVNTAVSLAASLNPKTVAFVGCDLGTLSLDKVRSGSAAGVSPRSFDRKVPANFGGECWTDAYMQDAILQLVGQIQLYSFVKYFNLSNGAQIKNATPANFSEYYDKISDSDLLCTSKKDMLNRWYSELRLYDPQLSKTLWEHGDFRHSVSIVIENIKDCLTSKDPFGFDSTLKMSRIFNLDDIPRHRQLAQRMLRGLIIKTWISIRRQHIIMMSNGDQSLIPRFDNSIKRKFLDLICVVEDEIYDLCDTIDSLFASC